MVLFSDADLSFKFKEKKKLKTFIMSIFSQENIEFKRLQYIFCSDEYLININRQFLQHDTYTDIITFALQEPNKPIDGEIYISLERVLDNSRIHLTDYNIELLRVIFHGALHLCGYKDKTKSQSILMRQKEDFYIQQYIL